MKNIFYQKKIYDIGGVETFLYQIAKIFKDRDIDIYYSTGDEKQIRRLRKYVRVIKYEGQKIVCDKAFFNYGLDAIDMVEANEYYEIIHADYIACKVQPHLHDKITKYFGVSEIACKSFKELTGIECEVLHNPIEIEQPEEILHLISATRLSPEKGKDRMLKLIDELDKYGKPWQWVIYTNDTDVIDNENVIYKKPRLDILNYIADSDYLVQLSDTEGFSYSILESLCIGTKVIATDIPALKDLKVEDNINGYILDFDLSNLDVDKIYKNKNKKFEYNKPKTNWSNILASGISTYEKERNTMYKLEVIKEISYSNYNDLIDIIPKNERKKGMLYVGDIIIVKGKDEADYLCGNNASNLVACKLIEEVKKTEDKKTSSKYKKNK